MVFCVGVRITGLSLYSPRLGVRGVDERSEEFDAWLGMEGGLENLELADRREELGRMSAGGARDLDGGGEFAKG